MRRSLVAEEMNSFTFQIFFQDILDTLKSKQAPSDETQAENQAFSSHE